MDRHRRPRLDGIQHPLRLVFRAIAEVQIHAEAGRGFGLGGEGLEDLLGDNHVSGDAEADGLVASWKSHPPDPSAHSGRL